MATRRQTYTRILQCSHTSVGLAQAHPNNYFKYVWHIVGSNFTSKVIDILSLIVLSHARALYMQ